MLRRTLPIVLCLAMAVPSLAQDTEAPSTMQEIEAAWAAGDYVTVREGLAELVEDSDDPFVFYRYGRVLAEGRGGPIDLGGAIAWLEKGAARAHAPSELLLARVLLSLPRTAPADAPEDPVRDPARAAKLLTSAAARGESEAQYYLGLLYSNGDGVAADPGQAVIWLRAAAEQDYAPAQFQLAQILRSGAGVAADDGEAMRWLGKAASSGVPEAQFLLAQAKFAGEPMPENTGDGITWLRRAAEAGHVPAQRDLGTRYLLGNVVAQNADEALRWLQTAAKAGDAGAMSNLGYAFAAGAGVPQDDARALAWYTRAADSGLARAMVTSAEFLAAGRGGAQDPVLALDYFRSALGTDMDAQARDGLGRLVSFGLVDGRVKPAEAVPWVMVAARSDNAEVRGTAEAWLEAQAGQGLTSAEAALALSLLADPERADDGMTRLKDAASKGDPAAQLALGRRLMTGEGVGIDYVAAHGWFNIAAALGHPEAVDLRGTAEALMTAEDIAEAQAFARRWFDEEQPMPPGGAADK